MPSKTIFCQTNYYQLKTHTVVIFFPGKVRLAALVLEKVDATKDFASPSLNPSLVLVKTSKLSMFDLGIMYLLKSNLNFLYGKFQGREKQSLCRKPLLISLLYFPYCTTLFEFPPQSLVLLFVM